VTTQQFVRLWLVAVSLAGTLNMMLALLFPHPIALLGWRPRLKWVALLPGIAIAVWGQLWLYHPTDPWAYALTWRSAYQLNALVLLGSLLIMAYRGFRSPAPIVRQQGRIILLGAVLGFGPVLLFLLGASLIIAPPSWLDPSFFIPPFVIYPLAIGYTIVRYGLLNVDVVLRRSVTYFLLTTLLVGVFSLFLTLLTAALGPAVVRNSPVLLALFIVLVTVLFDPLRTRLQAAVVAYVFKKPVSFDQLLRTYNRELKTAVDVHQIAIAMLQCVQQGIPHAEPQLYLPDSAGGGYRKYLGKVSGGSEQSSLSQGQLVDVQSPLVQFLQEGPGLVDLAEERIWPSELRQHRAAVRALDAAVLVPMNNEQHLLGWLLLSPKRNHKHFNSGEMSFLNSLADQSLIGLERANVIRRLETRIVELDHLSQFSQTLNMTVTLADLLTLVAAYFHTFFEVRDLSLALWLPNQQHLYTALYVMAGERHPDLEGMQQLVTDADVQQAVRLGQVVRRDGGENGRFVVTAPLNSGENTLGAIQTIHDQAEHVFSDRQFKLLTVLSDQIANAIDRLLAKEALQQQAQQLASINEVLLSLSSTLELDRLLELILDKAMDLLETEAGAFMLTREHTGELEFQVVRGPNSERLLGTRLPIGAGLAGSAAQSGQATLVNQVHQDSRWYDKMDAQTSFDSRSILTVPLLEENQVLGVIQVINKQDGGLFQEDDKQLLTAFAGQAVLALRNARLLDQTDKALQERVSELSLLQQLDRDLNTTLDVNRVLDLALGRIVRICQGEAGAIVLLDGEQRPFIRATLHYDNAFEPELVLPEQLENSVVGQVLRQQEPMLLEDVADLSGYLLAAPLTHGQMVVPLVHKQETIGAMLIESKMVGQFGEVELETAVLFTNHAAGAIANALLYQEVIAANLAKSEFVSMVSHELKTPMTSMSGFTDLLIAGVAGPVNEQQTEFLQTIKANVKRMSRQIQDLTDISQIETGRMSVKRQPCHFDGIVAETMQTVQQICDGKNMKLHIELPADLPPILADKERMVQVLTNLLSNACKYSPANGTIELSFHSELRATPRQKLPQPMVVCTVIDHGYGISEEDQARLFTKFFRSADPHIRQALGTGLGLSITKGLIELHGGTIWVESRLGEGTTFSFTIPCLPATTANVTNVLSAVVSAVGKA
jgi:signal transduction histidine kinase